MRLQDFFVKCAFLVVIVTLTSPSAKASLITMTVEAPLSNGQDLFGEFSSGTNITGQIAIVSLTIDTNAVSAQDVQANPPQVTTTLSGPHLVSGRVTINGTSVSVAGPASPYVLESNRVHVNYHPNAGEQIYVLAYNYFDDGSRHGYQTIEFYTEDPAGTMLSSPDVQQAFDFPFLASSFLVFSFADYEVGFGGGITYSKYAQGYIFNLVPDQASITNGRSDVDEPTAISIIIVSLATVFGCAMIGKRQAHK